MSKTGQWVMGMQEDATWMSRDAWAAKHGASNLPLYDETQEDAAWVHDGPPDDYAVKIETANRSEEVAANDDDLFNKVVGLIAKSLEDKETRQ